jgi:hypothetical protein
MGGGRFCERGSAWEIERVGGGVSVPEGQNKRADRGLWRKGSGNHFRISAGSDGKGGVVRLTDVSGKSAAEKRSASVPGVGRSSGPSASAFKLLSPSPPPSVSEPLEDARHSQGPVRG